MLAAIFANTNGLNSSGFDRPDQLDARGGVRQRRYRRPRFEDIVFGIARVDDVLCQQRRVVPGPFGTQ
jgi:hypothetical protein